MKTKFLLLILLLILQTKGFAQTPLPCANGRFDTAALNRAIDYERMYVGRTAAYTAVVRIYVHIIANDNGSNPALTDQQMISELDVLKTRYAPFNICFILAGSNRINSSFLNNSFNVDTDPNGLAFNSFRVPGCMNIFYLQTINGTNNSCSPPCGIGGVALGGIPGTFFLVGNGNIGGRTISHEMGHSLGLLHTFETAFGIENINGSNSTTAGDKVTDTPADPYAYNALSCYLLSFDSCSYIGNCSDLNGDQNFNPPYSNLLSYWSSNCYPNTTMSTGQFNRMASMLALTQSLIDCKSVSANITQLAMTQSTGYYMKSTIANFATAGTVTFSGSVNALLGGGQVVALPGFSAVPTGNGQITIAATPCDY